MNDDPIYTKMLRRDALKYRYQITHAPNGGVILYDGHGDLAASFSNPADAAEWMQGKLADFEKQSELAA